jgi:hypothetical protein
MKNDTGVDILDILFMREKNPAFTGQDFLSSFWMIFLTLSFTFKFSLIQNAGTKMTSNYALKHDRYFIAI